MPPNTASDVEVLPDFESAFMALPEGDREFLLSLNRRPADEAHRASWEKDWANDWKQWIK